MGGSCTASQDATPSAGDVQLTDAAECAESPRPAGFTQVSVDFFRALASHRNDPDWHEQNRGEIEAHLHRPIRALLAGVREGHIHPLSPKLAAGRRHISALRQNGYGRGSFHDHCRFAFYGPAVASKARSPQLYCKLDGAADVIEYGFAIGPGCDAHLQRLRKALRDVPDAVSDYLKSAPAGGDGATTAAGGRWPTGATW
jgi:uncharacterized protein (DUF2461 family)